MFIKKTMNGLKWTTDIWIALNLAMMLLVIFAEILLRQISNKSLTWHLELSQYCLINATYIGAAVALRYQNHISINLFTSMLPKRKEDLVNLIGKFIVLPFLIILAYSSYDILSKCRGVTPTLRLPKWTYYSPIFVGSVCLCIFATEGIIKDILQLRNTKHKNGSPPSESNSAKIDIV